MLSSYCNNDKGQTNRVMTKFLTQLWSYRYPLIAIMTKVKLIELWPNFELTCALSAIMTKVNLIGLWPNFELTCALTAIMTKVKLIVLWQNFDLSCDLSVVLLLQ